VVELPFELGHLLFAEAEACEVGDVFDVAA